jgi:hypothetical protein
MNRFHADLVAIAARQSDYVGQAQAAPDEEYEQRDADLSDSLNH